MEDYNIIHIEQGDCEHILKEPAKEVPFPLSEEHINLIHAMSQKFVDDNMAGLAAPQVGQPWKIILFHVTDLAMEIRDNAEGPVPLTLLINPSYEPVEENGKNNDWEACFSVHSTMGKVDRWNTIHFKGFNIEGELVEGIAQGFLARLIQHEIDHVNGVLFVDRLKPENTQGPTDEMRKMRLRELGVEE